MDRDQRLRSASEWLDALQGTQADAVAPLAPTTAVWSDPIIADEIARLVSATNSALAHRVSEKRKKDADRISATQAHPEKPPKPKQLVDLFGNPVHDVEAFLREQEETPEEAVDPEDDPPIAPPDPQPIEDVCAPERQSMVGGLLERMRPRKRNMPSAIPQN